MVCSSELPPWLVSLLRMLTRRRGAAANEREREQREQQQMLDAPSAVSG
jgi:hypothetical protein